MAIVRYSAASSPDRDWIDSQGRFAFGKHKGELIEDVASDDPSYLRWVVSEVEDISDEDRSLLAVHLKYAGKN